MSRRTEIAIGLFALAGLSLLVFIGLGGHTAHSYAQTGAVPTDNGWYALASSLLSAGGFSIAGIVTLLIRRFAPGAPAVTDDNVTEMTELSASFLALMKDRLNRAAQRRFIFAFVDSSQIIPGVTTSHANGVVTIQYSGFADPVTPTTKGA